MTTTERAVRDQEAAVRIIRGVLLEIKPSYDSMEVIHDAATILARLARAEPPLLLTSEDTPCRSSCP